MTEIIGHVPRNRIEAEIPKPSGFFRDSDRELYRQLRRNLAWDGRPALEEDSTQKQLIPYIVCQNDDGAFFTMQRKEAQTEKRLHQKISVGVGGHLERRSDTESADTDSVDPIFEGMRREFSEEVRAQVDEFEYLGVINDDTNDVGKVHLGLVYLARVQGGDIDVRETEKMTGEFLSLEALRDREERLESWSRIVLDQLDWS